MLTDTEESPEVKDLSQQISSLEKQLEETRGSAKTNYHRQPGDKLSQSLGREKKLCGTLSIKQRGETVAQNQAAINYNILKQEIETNKELLAGLMQRSKENDVQHGRHAEQYPCSGLRPVPKGPVGPRRMQAVMMALMLALAFGVGLALFLEYLDDTVKTPSDIESGLRLPVAGDHSDCRQNRATFPAASPRAAT